MILDIPERYHTTLGWTMTCEDLRRMATLERQADVMVNFATTVTLEAAITDTPTLLVAFSPSAPEEMQRYEPTRWQATAKSRADVAELKLSAPEPPKQTFDKSPFIL